MLWNKLGGLFESVSPVALDSDLALLGHPARLLVSHAEDIVGLHSPVDATVAGDGFFKLLYFLGLGHILDSEEHFGRVFVGLLLHTLVLVLKHGLVLVLVLGILLLLSLGVIGEVVTVEGVDLSWWNRLKNSELRSVS